MNEGLEMDPNPSSFLPLIFVRHNSTNLLPFTCIYNLCLSKLPPTSDTYLAQNLLPNSGSNTRHIIYICTLN